MARLVFTPTGNIDTTSLSSVTYDGVTWTLNQAMPVGYFVTGEPFVVSSEPFQITATSPASRDIASNGYIGDGVMQDPYCRVLGQGWDQYLTRTDGDATASVVYTESLNVDPSKPGGSAISIAQGASTSFVKAIRRAGVPIGDWQTFDRYVTLTVLPSAPPVGAYMPSPSELGTKTIYKRSDINTSALRSLTFPASWPSHASIKSKIASDIGLYGDGAATAFSEFRRRFRLDKVLGGASNYSANIADHYARYLLNLHNNAISSEERQEIIDFVMKCAIQIRGLTSRGWDRPSETQVQASLVSGAGGAGQFGNVAPYCFVAGYLTNSNDFIEITKLTDATTLRNSHWITEKFLSLATPGASGAASRGGQAFFSEQIGRPVLIPDEITSAHTGRYTPIGSKIVGWEVMAMGLMRNGPNSRDGFAEIMNGGPLSTATPRAAVIAAVDVIRSETPFIYGTYPMGQDWYDLYDSFRDLSAVPIWTGKPSQMAYGEAAAYNDDFFDVPSDGVIRFTLPSGWNFSTESVTGRDFRYSLDGRQWVTEENITLSSNQYTKSGLLRGAAHWCGVRQKSTSGAGMWSPNFPLELPLTSGLDRGKRTTTGTATATAPSYAGGVAPSILQRVAPQWAYEVWEPASGADLNVREMAAGVGYPSAGFPAPTYTYQWRRDGVNIAGETTYKLTVDPLLDRGKAISCEVTAANASGSTSSTPSITAPSYFGMEVPQSTTWGSTTAASSDSRTVDIGPAHADRWLIAVLCGEADTATSGNNMPHTLTIGGVAFTRVRLQHSVRNPDGAYAQIWASNAKIPTGTTATADWSTLAGNTSQWHGMIFQLIKSTAPTVVGGDGWSMVLSDKGYQQTLTAPAANNGFAVTVGRMISGVQQTAMQLDPKPNFYFETFNPTARQDWVLFGAEHTTGETYAVDAITQWTGTFAFTMATFS
jgi:hypothetical protein